MLVAPFFDPLNALYNIVILVYYSQNNVIFQFITTVIDIDQIYFETVFGIEDDYSFLFVIFNKIMNGLLLTIDILNPIVNVNNWSAGD